MTAKKLVIFTPSKIHEEVVLVAVVPGGSHQAPDKVHQVMVVAKELVAVEDRL